MKIFSREQIRQWDEATMHEQHISSFELMERAAYTCANWIQQHIFPKKRVWVFCGTGNNGGDGLAISRILLQWNVEVHTFVMEGNRSTDNQLNLELLRTLSEVHELNEYTPHPAILESDLVIDALYGIGLNKPPQIWLAGLIKHINQTGATIVSIDVPSGMYADPVQSEIAITATHTLTFEAWKPAFFLPENELFTGTIHELGIGLSQQYAQNTPAKFHFTHLENILPYIQKRKQHAHKGVYGHAALVAGSMGMSGAAILAAKGCLRSGVGKLTNFTPEACYAPLQTAVPAAMCRVSGKKKVRRLEMTEKFDAAGIGPGLGRYKKPPEWMDDIIKMRIPLVWDADALNALAKFPALLNQLPAGSILTPHPGEFSRLFPTVSSQLETALVESKQRNIYIILKGRYTLVATPEGTGHFNSTGNPGMARGGMGDVLTGIITGLLAQGYDAKAASILGVYWHGAAGDLAAEKYSEASMQPEDLLNAMGAVWKSWL